MPPPDIPEERLNLRDIERLTRNDEVSEQQISFSPDSRWIAFSAPDDAFGIGLLSAGPLRAGPAVAIQGERKDSDVGVPLGRVKRTFEVGGFAEIMMLDQFRFRADLRKGVNGHEGMVGSIGADQIWRDKDRYVVSIGPRLLYSDSRYQRAYFGVTPEAALATGLPAYRPGGGVHAIAAAFLDSVDDRFVNARAPYADLVAALSSRPVDVLHLATHASFNGRSELSSSQLYAVRAPNFSGCFL